MKTLKKMPARIAYQIQKTVEQEAAKIEKRTLLVYLLNWMRRLSTDENGACRSHVLVWALGREIQRLRKEIQRGEEADYK